MAQCEVQLDLKIFSCFFCLDLLKDPVTTSCGHTYCMKCLQHHWDAEAEGRVYSCPQCDRTFTARPVLEKNTMLAGLVEKTGLQAAPAEPSSPGAEDVACDVCTGTKLKALKSCLVCRASYCESHLQPHRDAAPLQRHTLVEPVQELQENYCFTHNEVMKMFCCTDQQNICYLCAMDEHEGHDIITVAALERQREQEETSEKFQQMTLSNTVVLVPEPEPEPEPKSREDFLKYACQITLDPNTANEHLLLSEGNRKVTFTEELQPYCDHPHRFTGSRQVLSRESLTGRCYWEVEWTGGWGVDIAVSYWNIKRKQKCYESKFGRTTKSHSCFFSSTGKCFPSEYSYVSGLKTSQCPGSSRVGVYLDHRAGIVCFYRPSETGTMTLLHKFQTYFTEPLHAGLAVSFDSSAEIMKL